jgi:Ca2+/Na+ antiporter
MATDNCNYLLAVKEAAEKADAERYTEGPITQFKEKGRWILPCIIMTITIACLVAFITTQKQMTGSGKGWSSLFILAIMAPIAIVTMSDMFWHMTWLHIGVFIALYSTFIGLLISNYIQGKKKAEDGKLTCDDEATNVDEALYQFLTCGSWTSFKVWLSFQVSEPMTDLLMAFCLIMFPFPFLPDSSSHRFELFLAKVGVYKICVALILGPAKYYPEKDETILDLIAHEKEHSFSDLFTKYHVTELLFILGIILFVAAPPIWRKIRKLPATIKACPVSCYVPPTQI